MQQPPQISLTQAQRTANSDAAMMDAAIDLIVRQGTERTTLKALGEAAGYSRGLVTYRFGNKAGLFKAVIKSVSERWIKDLGHSVGQLDGVPAVIAAADAYLRYIRRSPREIRALNILFHLAVEPGSELKGLVRRVVKAQRDQLVAWVMAGRSQGGVSNTVCAETFAVQFLAYTNGMTWMWMLSSRDIDWDRAHVEFKRFIQDKLSAPDNKSGQPGEHA